MAETMAGRPGPWLVAVAAWAPLSGDRCALGAFHGPPRQQALRAFHYYLHDSGMGAAVFDFENFGRSSPGRDLAYILGLIKPDAEQYNEIITWYHHVLSAHLRENGALVPSLRAVNVSTLLATADLVRWTSASQHVRPSVHKRFHAPVMLELALNLLGEIDHGQLLGSEEAYAETIMARWPPMSNQSHARLAGYFERKRSIEPSAPAPAGVGPRAQGTTPSIPGKA